MLPIVFEWNWDIGHIIFMGLFYLALTVIVTALMVAFIRTIKSLDFDNSFPKLRDKH